MLLQHERDLQQLGELTLRYLTPAPFVPAAVEEL